jgi:hypothetical protein
LLKLRFGAIAAVLLFFMGTAAMAQTISIQLDGGAFKVVGWQAPTPTPAKGWPSIFVVYAGAGDVPPLLGTYAVEGGPLVFHPTFPLAPGVRYRAVFQLPGGGTVEKIFYGPHKETTPSARVVRVYPSTDVLPSNELKLYIYFSAPMSRGEAGERIHLVDENGKVLEDVFLPAEELWDPNNQRLTVIFDPGRIKRGLTSNQKMGPPIAEGRRYTLVIDRDWKDARDVRMVEGFRKQFRGGPEDRNPPDPKQWRVTAPKAGTRDALSVDFGKPMDYPLLERMLEVSGSVGKVAGTVSVERQETQWRFTPQNPWKGGDYNLIVDTALEDLAGNHIGQAFDIDTFAPITEHITTKTISLPFSIR